jgi:hypothetical protein
MRSVLLTAVAALALAGCAKTASAPPANTALAQTNSAAPAAPVSTANPAPVSVNVALGSNPAAQGANGPPGPATVDIAFQRGASCWRYVGVAATFNGRFAAGQKLDVTSTGEQANGSGTANWYETRPRNVYVAAPGGQLLTADASGYFEIPADGAYQITFDPMSMVGAPGVMIVCTL